MVPGSALRRAQRGDDAAFRAVYREVQPGLLRFDLTLIAHLFALDADELRRVIETILAARATHEPPRDAPPPPTKSGCRSRHLARAVGLDGDLDASTAM